MAALATLLPLLMLMLVLMNGASRGTALSHGLGPGAS